ncbi:unnamed protein product [Diplocarpon coronariae]
MVYARRGISDHAPSPSVGQQHAGNSQHPSPRTRPRHHPRTSAHHHLPIDRRRRATAGRGIPDRAGIRLGAAYEKEYESSISQPAQSRHLDSIHSPRVPPRAPLTMSGHVVYQTISNVSHPTHIPNPPRLGLITPTPTSYSSCARRLGRGPVTALDGAATGLGRGWAGERPPGLCTLEMTAMIRLDLISGSHNARGIAAAWQTALSLGRLLSTLHSPARCLYPLPEPGRQTRLRRAARSGDSHLRYRHVIVPGWGSDGLLASRTERQALPLRMHPARSRGFILAPGRQRGSRTHPVILLSAGPSLAPGAVLAGWVSRY